MITRRGFLSSAGIAAAGMTAGLTAARQAAAALAQHSEASKMKITQLETILIDNIDPPIGHRKWLFIQLHTDEGLVGLGERVSGGAVNLKPQIELLNDLFDRFVKGQSPFDVEKIWQQMKTSLHDYSHPGLYGVPAFSAIEMACWDLIGKATNQPIYNLLGGRYHDQLRAYAYLNSSGIWENPSLAGERAQELVERGITCCKLDPFSPITGPPRDYSLKTIRHVATIFRAMRDAVGDELEIGIGTHGQFSTAVAIRVADLLEEFDPYFFEEPVPPENVDEMARVAAHTNIPIATGERLVNRFEFAEVLEKQAAQIIQLDVGQCGGILEAKKIAGMAETHYAMIAPHMYCGPVAASAAVQLDTCSPNFLIPGVQHERPAQRHLRGTDPLRERIHRTADRARPRRRTRPCRGREASSRLSRRLTLAILAAGRSARFGRPKTLEPVGPNGDVLFEYAICDAIRAGCGKVVFVTSADRTELIHEPSRRVRGTGRSRRLRDPEPRRRLAGRRAAAGRASQTVGHRPRRPRAAKEGRGALPGRQRGRLLRSEGDRVVWSEGSRRAGRGR